MNLLKKLYLGLYLHPRFYYYGVGVVFLFVVAFFVPALFFTGILLFFILVLVTVMDIIILFNADRGIQAERILPEKMSNGDSNEVVLVITNLYTFGLPLEIVDEIPESFQERHFMMVKKMEKTQTARWSYYLRPTFRGKVHFGKLHIYVATPLCLIKRKFTFDLEKSVPVYPSFIQLKKYELMAFSPKLLVHGLKKIRRLGHTLEFEQIKEYVSGDDFRTVNWKATAKSNKLMVNQYQDERSQSVYCLLDKGRVMKMPFDGLSLLDYAINACLVISNVVLRKQDYIGFLSFSRKIENRVAPERRGTQMQRIVDALYNVRTDFFESDYGRLYADVKKNIPHRSLLLLFTNFETLDGLNRQLPYLKAMAKNHLLIAIFFQNTELDELIHAPATDMAQIYDKVIAEKFSFEKKLIVQELKKYGIPCILTRPENLTLDTINKYLEIKARGMI